MNKKCKQVNIIRIFTASKLKSSSTIRVKFLVLEQRNYEHLCSPRIYRILLTRETIQIVHQTGAFLYLNLFPDIRQLSLVVYVSGFEPWISLVPFTEI